MRRVTASVLVASIGIAMLGMASPVGAQSIAGGACSLLTLDEISGAFGGKKWVIAEGADEPLNCYYHNNLFDRKSKALNVKYTLSDELGVLEFQDLIRDGYTDEIELTVGGFPALQIGSTLHVFTDPTAWLSLDAISEKKADEGKLPELAELAVARLATSLSAPGEAGFTSDACSILTVEEVSAALGETVTVAEGDPVNCVYMGDVAAGSLTSLSVNLSPLEPRAAEFMTNEIMATLPGAAALEIGGIPAIQGGTETLETGGSTSELFLMAGDQGQLVYLSAQAPAGVDAATALVSLAELAVPRFAG